LKLRVGKNEKDDENQKLILHF